MKMRGKRGFTDRMYLFNVFFVIIPGDQPMR